MASVPDSASVPSAERERGIEKTDELRRLKNARNRRFESSSLHRRVYCEPEFSGGHRINDRRVRGDKASVAQARDGRGVLQARRAPTGAKQRCPPLETAWPMWRFSTGNWRKALKRATTIPNRGAKRKIAAAPG